MLPTVPNSVRRTSISALIADHNDPTREIHAHYLRSSSFLVDEGVDGREALALAISNRRDIIIAEAELRGIDGYQLSGLLRRDASTRDTPIILLGDNPCPADVTRAIASGATLLAKPCLPQV